MHLACQPGPYLYCWQETSSDERFNLTLLSHFRRHTDTSLTKKSRSTARSAVKQREEKRFISCIVYKSGTMNWKSRTDNRACGIVWKRAGDAPGKERESTWINGSPRSCNAGPGYVSDLFVGSCRQRQPPWGSRMHWLCRVCDCTELQHRTHACKEYVINVNAFISLSQEGNVA